ncbi:MAG TPA: SUF system NifU family Fe-S cluster assembly protein [Vicinamibacteria bacterium]|nr:SUF system NifU family Fe-S cluster assembly protein [Vicinamibacteria bacterium]
MNGDDLRELYQEVILDHSKRPRNFREMAAATHRAVGHNPLCGDRATIYLRVEDGVVKDVSFHGAGCSISTASASMMTDAVRGKTVEQAMTLFQRFHELVTADPSRAAEVAPELGKLAVFAGVHEFPVRVKCASLAWHTMKAALEGGAGATTE